MNWKNFHKTYKKAVLVRFPDQNGLGKYLSKTFNGLRFVLSSLILWPEGTKKLVGDHCDTFKAKQC